MHKAFATGLLALTLATPAVALPLGPAAMFNAYSLTDFDYRTVDIEGIIGASGNVTYTYGDVGRRAGATPYSVYAGGDVTIKYHHVTNGGIQAGGNIYVQNTTIGGDLSAKGDITMSAGSFTRPVKLASEGTISVNNNGITGSAFSGGNFNGTSGNFFGDVSASGGINTSHYGIHGSRTSGAPAPVVDIIDHRAISSAIVNAGSVFASLAPTAGVVDTNVNPTVHEWLFKGDSGLNVFAMGGDMLTRFASITFDGPVDATFIVNVLGQDIDILNPGGFNFRNGADGSMVLFNLVEATAFDLHGSFWGAFLAPHAAATHHKGTLHGGLYANAISGYSQINSVFFASEFETPRLSSANQVPAPPALALIALGLVGLRRRMAGVAPSAV